MTFRKIGVVGPGALGSYYGAQCLRAGYEVHFLLRSDYEVVRERGVRIRSAEEEFVVRPQCARFPEEIGECDLVFVALKSTANGCFPQLLPPLVGRDTALLTLQNGLGNEEALAAIFGAGRVMGGLCFVCLNRLEPGLIVHLAHGRVVLGECSGPPVARTHAIARVFTEARVPCQVTENLALSHWKKLVWNIPFNGLGVASAAGLPAVLSGRSTPAQRVLPCLTTDLLLADPGWQRLVRELMREVIATAGALELPIEPTIEQEYIDDTLRMGAYKSSTVIDFERGQPLELEGLFLAPLREADRLAVPVPRLRALAQILGELGGRQK
jgi:2-dehydropantoate 2-reductase